jgi:hypothetical protein
LVIHSSGFPATHAEEPPVPRTSALAESKLETFAQTLRVVAPSTQDFASLDDVTD